MEVFEDLYHLSNKFGPALKLYSDSEVQVGIPLRLLRIPNSQFKDTSTEIRISLTDMVVGLEPKDGIKDPDRLLCSLQNIDDTQKRTVRGIIEHVIGNDIFSDGTVSPDEQTSEHSSRSIDDTETPDPDQHTSATRSSNSGGEGYSKYKDKYTKESKLGYGGFGSVYKCRNNSDDSNYAVKFVAFDECREELRELRAMSLAQHPNVVRCVDAWIENVAPHSLSGGSEDSISTTNSSLIKTPKKAVCMAMECCSSTLGKELEKKRFDLGEALKIAEEITRGLCHIHEQGIIHLDTNLTA